MYFNSWCLTYIKSTKCKYANTNGAENNTPSNLSSIPPCPGRILPESFTPVLLFICDSVKSPNVPNTTIKNEQVIQCKIELSVKNANKNPVANATTAPPIAPSHVLFGETRSNNFVLPKVEPAKYAPVSFAHCITKKPNKKT